VARRFFGVAAPAYFDDYDIAEPEYAGESGKHVLRSLHEFLGMPLSDSKKVRMAVHNPFLGVVTDFSRFASDGKVTIRPKPSRVAKLVKGLQEALEEDFLPSSQAEEWAGKLEFLTLSSGFHRVSRAAIEEFRAFWAATRSGGPGSSVEERGLPESLKEAIGFLIILLPCLPPRTIDVRSPIAPPLVVYTDAAYEPDSAVPAGMGACVFDPTAPEGLQWVVAGCEVGPEILESTGANASSTSANSRRWPR
jgi:hypothetical protein